MTDLIGNDGKRNLQYLADFEFDDINLDFIDQQLSEEDERVLMEIEGLQKEIEQQPTFMKDLLEATKKGAMNYLDSMTDTGDNFNSMKDPKSVSDLNDVEIEKKNKSANPDENAGWKPRTMEEAKYNPIDNNVKVESNVDGMSPTGMAKFNRHKEAYSQRTKSITAISRDGNNIHYKTDSTANFESLSGLRGYRVGPVVAMPSVQDMKDGFTQAVKEGKKIKDGPAGYIRDQNYDAFDKALMKEYGFKTKSQAAQWRRDNHLTIHEDPDGMFLVPSDVHDSASHSGYVSALEGVLKGEEGAEQKLTEFKHEAARRYIGHEVRARGIRAGKGMLMSLVKDLMKHTIFIIGEETYLEFKEKKEDNLIERIKRILRKCWDSVKGKVKKILKNIGQNLKGSLLNELLTAVNDFLLGTFKNIFKIIRQMFGSIKSAFKIICSKTSTWEDRIFEASKVLSAGIVGIIGFSLNEIIEKGLMAIGFPFASFVSECLSGLFAGILSSLVIMLFDHTKAEMKVHDKKLQVSLLQSKSIAIDTARLSVASIRIEEQLCSTFEFFQNTYLDIVKTRQSIQFSQKEVEENTTKLRQTIGDIKRRTKILGDLASRNIDDDF